LKINRLNIDRRPSVLFVSCYIPNSLACTSYIVSEKLSRSRLNVRFWSIFSNFAV